MIWKTESLKENELKDRNLEMTQENKRELRVKKEKKTL